MAGKLRTSGFVSTYRTFTMAVRPGKTRMQRRSLNIAVLGIVLGINAWSQPQTQADSLDFSHAEIEGVRLYGISTFLGYSNFTIPNAATSSITSHANYGVTGSAGWQRFHGRTNFSVRYSGTYYGDARQSDLNSLNHSLDITVSRQLGRRWSVDLSATGQDMSLQQLIWQTPALGSLSQTPATFDNLAASMSVGQYTDPQSGLVLGSSASTLSTPATAVLFGSQVLSYAAHVGVAYAHSSRLTLRFGSFALGGERRTGNNNNVPGAQLNYIMPKTLGGDASASLSYALTPRTEIDLGVGENYIRTSFQRSFGTNATAGVGRKMGQHWFLRGYAGGYVAHIVQQATGIPATRQIIGGGSIGFQTYSHTLLGAYTRSGYDLHTAAVGATTTSSAAWNWHSPRRSWGLHASFNRTGTGSTGYATVGGWQAMGGFSQRIADNLLLQATYSYFRSRGVYLGFANDVTGDAVRISFGWSPKARHTSPGIRDGEPEQSK
jgi:hypothetical protein